jgi:hypothetical protein
MKLNQITLKNIYAFFQGHFRYRFKGLPGYIREQVVLREILVKEISPECLNGHCKICKCKTPELFYSSKACEGNCYPEMLNESEWKKFKLKNK